MPDTGIVYRKNPQGGLDADVMARAASAFFTANARGEMAVFDPDRPHVGPNELYAEMGGTTDPRLMNHNCPFCRRTMAWDLFVAHMKRSKEGPGCFERWYKTVDPTFRRFTGASIGEGNG